MPFCTHCGATISEDAGYCVHCGTAIKSPQQAVLISESPTIFSGWVVRFVAWLIDVIIVSVALIPLKGVMGLLDVRLPGLSWLPFINFGIDNVFYFLYWTFTEGTYNQSIGKMVVGIRVTTVNGRPINLGTAVVESLGKAFLLPLDCLVGWILYPTRKQRLFNYLSDTMIAKT